MSNSHNDLNLFNISFTVSSEFGKQHKLVNSLVSQPEEHVQIWGENETQNWLILIRNFTEYKKESKKLGKPKH